MADRKTGPELMDEMVEEPTLDYFFQNNPNKMTDAEFEHFVRIQRQNRAKYIKKDA